MTTLTQKAQVTIPKNIREILGLNPGDEVEFSLENNSVTLHKQKKKLPFHRWQGYLGSGKTDELIKELR